MPNTQKRRAGARDAGRKRARRILDDLTRSGESLPAYCAAHGLSRSTVYRWRRELAGATSDWLRFHRFANTYGSIGRIVSRASA